MSEQAQFQMQDRLAVDGIDPGLSLQGGRVYALLEEDERLAAGVVWTTVLDACGTGRKCCLVSLATAAKAPPMLEQALGKFQASGLLSVFDAGARRSRSPIRLKQLVDDLQHWGERKPCLLLIAGAEQLLADAGADAWRRLRDWTESSGNCLLLVMRGLDSAGESDDKGWAAHACGLGGMARLKSRYGAAALEVFHWWPAHGALVAGKTFPLQAGADGRYRAEESAAAAGLAAQPAADEALTLASRDVFLPKEALPPDWRIVDGDLEQLAARLADATAATVILPFSRSTSFDLLARTIFDLRKRCGSRLKLVVREVNTRLRYSQEAMLVRLGANLVVPAEISYPRFLSQTTMVQGQLFPHLLPVSYEQAVHAAMPEQEQGYVPPAEFARVVQDTLEGGRVLNVQSTLVRLPLAYGLRPADALRYCTIKRAGDLCSNDESSVYLFLYACRESDIDKTLDRLFDLPTSELFAPAECYVAAHAIAEAVQAYDSRQRGASFADLSGELGSLATSSLPQPRAEAPAPAEKKERGPVRYAAPAPAVRRPLPVRAAPILIDVSLPST